MALSWSAPNARVRIDYGQGVTKATIFSRGTVVSVIVTLAMLAFWSFGGMFAVVMLGVATQNGDSGAFFMIWLTAWVVGEIGFVMVILWKLFGTTLISATPKGLKVSRRILGIGGSHLTPAKEVTGFSFVFDDPTTTVRVNGRRIPQSGLRMHTGGRTTTLISGIGRDDAEAMVAAFNQRLLRGRASQPREERMSADLDPSLTGHAE